jgi:type IV pilus assembly protein PilM
MQLTRQKKPSALVGLDIEAGSIAATELSVNGSVHVTASAIAPLAPGAFHEGEVSDPDALAGGLKDLFSQHKISKQVRLGVGNQGVVVRKVSLPAIEDPKELDAAVRFQAQEQIPMPLDQAVLQFQVVGGLPAEEGMAPRIEVIVIAARREMISALLSPVRKAGLEPVGIDLAAFGMIRALAGIEIVEESAETVEATPRRPDTATLYCSVGDVMNIAVARGLSCLFTRTSHAGLEPVVARLAAARGLTDEHASLWLDHVGMVAPLEQLDGDPAILADARRELEAGVPAMADELRLSLDYYRAQEGAIPVERVVICGPGSVIEGINESMGESLGLPVSCAHPPALDGYDPHVAARLTIAFGLALNS